MVRISLLGPLKIDAESGEAVLGAAKERSLLTALALNPGRVVGADVLIEALWGDAPPVSARKTLQTYVSNVRRVLGSDVLATEGAGYVLRIAPDEVDVVRFRALVNDGERALREGSIEQARQHLGEAVALWRGEPFPSVGPHTGLAAEATRLREEYLTALEARLAADLADGHEAELIGELEALVHKHPFRERLWGHLVLALYRDGRQGDALAAYERARVILREELGLEPGGELRRLERAVLAQDPSLDRPSRHATPSPETRELPRSPVRYALGHDGVHVAYQIVGEGPIDVLAVPGFVSHLDMWWNAPTDHLVRRLASFSRLILFDKRGMGLSDRPPHVDVEQWVEDTQAVLDAVGSERAVVIGISAGAPTAALFAAGHPERTRSLILYGGYPRFLTGDGYDFGVDPDVVDSFIRHVEANWGTGVGISTLAPSRAADRTSRDYWARCQTTSASPGAAAAFLRALAEIDVRQALPTISVPTLILHAQRDQNTPIEGARLMRDLIPGAKLVELDTDIHLIWLSDMVEDITREIEAFIRRTVPGPANDRVFATVLAVAPAPSTRRARAIDAAIRRFRGRSYRGAACATFDGPAQAIRCALALVSELASDGGHVAFALHSGECELGQDRVSGIAADLAEQLAATSISGEVLVSQTIRDLLVGSTIELEARGRREFERVPGEWDVFAVASAGR